MAYSLASLSAGQAIQAIYIGYYTRAADPYGFEFWLDLYQEHLDGDADGDAGLSLAGIANDFATQAETKAAYPFFESPNLASATNFITQVYLNLFDRVPDQAGLDFWAGVLSAGTLPTGEIVMAIIEGAVGGDIDTLSNKIEAATYFSQQAAENGIGTESNPITNDPEAMAAAKAAVDGAGNDGFGADDLAASKAATDAFIGDYGVVTPDDETFILTSTTDVVVGGDGNDTILGNEATLNNSDDLDGGAGDDILKVSVSAGSGDLFVAPTLSNIETVEVNGPNIDYTQDITIDLSNADGYSTLRSFQTTVNAPFTPWMPVVAFRDIQNVNGTDIEIIDTDVDHLYTYDTNAYATLGGGLDDAADILVQEVDGSDIILANEDGGRSDVDIVNLTSLDRSQVNSTTFNYIDRLEVGASFNELNVTGDADLEIEHFLDENLNDVDASTLDGDFIVDLIGQGERVPHANAGQGDTPFAIEGNLDVLGSMGDNRVDVFGDTNGSFVFQGGDDTLRVGNASDTGYERQDVFGHLLVNTDAGDDTVRLNVTGVQQVALGAGDDSLIINGNVDDLNTLPFNDGVSQISAGDGDDYVELNGQGDAPETLDNDYLIGLGDGDDTLIANEGGDHTIDGGDGNDSIGVFGDGDQVIDSGAGDDDVQVNGDGDQTVVTGAGDDDVTLNSNGDHTVSLGDGNDTGAINGDGVHNVDLGAGDDSFVINGSRLDDNNIDNTIEDRQTTINAGDGDDYVGVFGDHYLLADLGAGNDTLEMHADELSADDAIDGNNGIDTLALNNDSGRWQDGRVGASETSSTQSIEIFDLLDSNISLRLTSDNFDTAQDNHITVVTTNAEEEDLPLVPVAGGELPLLHNGMTRADYNAAAAQYVPGVGDPATLNDFLLENGVNSIHFVDENADGDADVVSMSGQQFAAGDNADTVDFQAEVGGAHTIDITDVPLSIASGRSFELQGGNIRDIVIADDASINGRLILDYDYSTDTNHSAEDTLQVIDGAQITAADLRNVNGLEIIELMSASNDSQIWNIELNDRVINQTTGNADLIIRVDPDVPEGSQVVVQLDESIWSGTATNDVIIENVANAEVWIAIGDNAPFLVTEPMYGSDLIANMSAFGTIIVNERLVFTENTDSLVGDETDNTFWFDSISELQAADSADGKGGHDTLVADGVTVSNQGESLLDQLGGPQLVSIEEIDFQTGMNVQMTQLDGGKGSKFANGLLSDMLNTLRTGEGDDTLLNMERIGLNREQGYFLNGGNDVFVSQGGNNDEDFFIDGGLGIDTVTLRTDDNGTVTDVEFITLEFDADVEIFTSAGVETEVQVQGDEADDYTWVELQNPILTTGGVLATVRLFDVNEVRDNSGDSLIVLDNDEVGGPDGDANIVLNAGVDRLTVTNVNVLSVTAGAGEKNVDVGGGNASNVETFTYNGGTGVNGGVDNVASVTDDDTNISTGDLADTINATTTQDGDVTIDGGSGNDTITVDADGFASVTGGSGDDVIDVLAEDGAYVDGGSGNDDITVVVDGTWTSMNATVQGGTGADEIDVTTFFGNTASIDTGLGGDGEGDVVNLYTPLTGAAPLSGIETIRFGDIVYDNTQNVDTANTTQNFLQKGLVSPVADVEGYSDSIDMIYGFNAEGGIFGVEDIFDFSAFISDDSGNPFTDLVTADWTGGKTNVDMENILFTTDDAEIAVIAVNQGFELTGADITSTEGALGIEIEDNVFGGERAVVVTMYDTDNDGGLDTADIYFVQDLDSDLGEVWAVDKVATVEFATEVGLGSLDTFFDDNFIIG